MVLINNKIDLAGSGIGLACSLALAKKGCRVVITGRRAGRLEKVAQSINELDFNRSPQTATSETFIK